MPTQGRMANGRWSRLCWGQGWLKGAEDGRAGAATIEDGHRTKSTVDGRRGGIPKGWGQDNGSGMTMPGQGQNGPGGAVRQMQERMVDGQDCVWAKVTTANISSAQAD